MKSADGCKHNIHIMCSFYMLNAKTALLQNNDQNMENFYSWQHYMVVKFESYMCHPLTHTKRYLISPSYTTTHLIHWTFS
jgi:hypothetical protein